MRLFGLVLAFLVGGFASANPLTLDYATLLNHAGTPFQKSQLGTVLREAHSQAVCNYNFAVSGGAISTITLKNCDLPINAVVDNFYVEVVTGLTSGGSATIALGYNTTTDMKAATAYTSFASGWVQGVPTGAVANMVKLTAARSLKLTIATAALTAGKLVAVTQYYISQ